jgi:hypothetical protein
MPRWADGGGGLGMGSGSELSAEVALRTSGSGRVCDSSDRETNAAVATSPWHEAREIGKGMKMHRMSALRRLLAVGAIMVGCAVGSLGFTTATVSAATASQSTTAATPMTTNDWCSWNGCRGSNNDWCRWHDCRDNRNGDWCRWHDCRGDNSNDWCRWHDCRDNRNNDWCSWHDCRRH